MSFQWVTSVISSRMGITTDDFPMLSQLSHTYSFILFTYMCMCDSGDMWGSRSRSCYNSYPISRSFIFISPLSLSNDNKRRYIVVKHSECQMKHCPEGSQQMPPMIFLEANIAPNQVDGIGSGFCRCVVPDPTSFYSTGHLVCNVVNGSPSGLTGKYFVTKGNPGGSRNYRLTNKKLVHLHPEQG